MLKVSAFATKSSINAHTSFSLPACLPAYCRAHELVLMELVIGEFDETLSVHSNFG